MDTIVCPSWPFIVHDYCDPCKSRAVCEQDDANDALVFAKVNAQNGVERALGELEASFDKIAR
jgi:hypothetical protein